MFTSIHFNEILELAESNRKRVLMTGFAPYDHLKTNPSWEGVNYLDKSVIENKYDIILIKELIPVRYSDVDEIVPKLLDLVQPDLTIHVGVGPVSSFVLETQAKRYEYKFHDVDKKLPAHGRHVCEGHDTIVTQLDVAAIGSEFNRNAEDLRAELSTDAGLFLCEYIYYTTLSHGQIPTLFVHVPETKYTTEQIAQGLERILELCLKELDKNSM